MRGRDPRTVQIIASCDLTAFFQGEVACTPPMGHIDPVHMVDEQIYSGDEEDGVERAQGDDG